MKKRLLSSLLSLAMVLTLLPVSALAAEGVPVELHIYPHGGHGLSLANELMCDRHGIYPKVQSWIGFAKEWIKGR